MEYEDVIKMLKEEKALYESEYCTSGDGTPDGQLLSAFDEAIKACEKQIQKKPIKSDKTIRYCEVWKCPNCCFEWSGRVVDYCYRCGQAINWEGVKEEE